MAKQRNRSTSDKRENQRLKIRCPARVRVGNRQYAAYLANISEAGACIVTLSALRDTGPVIVRLPDLPPLHGQIRWADNASAGIAFKLKPNVEMFAKWVAERERD